VAHALGSAAVVPECLRVVAVSQRALCLLPQGSDGQVVESQQLRQQNLLLLLPLMRSVYLGTRRRGRRSPSRGRHGRVTQLGPVAAIAVPVLFSDKHVIVETRLVIHGAPTRRRHRRGCRSGDPAARPPRCQRPCKVLLFLVLAVVGYQGSRVQLRVGVVLLAACSAASAPAAVEWRRLGAQQDIGHPSMFGI
jgi:hypothetical protein